MQGGEKEQSTARVRAAFCILQKKTTSNNCVAKDGVKISEVVKNPLNVLNNFTDNFAPVGMLKNHVMIFTGMG